MTTIITNDPGVDSAANEFDPETVRVLPTFDSAVAILVLATILAVGGWFLPTSIRWVMWPLAMFVPGHAIVSATFGPHLDFGGFRRAGMSVALSMVAYPLIALTGVVVGLRLTHAFVVLGMWTLTSGCAAVVHRRSRSEANSEFTPESEFTPTHGTRIRVSQLIVPFGAIFLSMFIAWGSLHVFPRQAPDNFSSIALEGTWALTARSVPADPDSVVEVTFRIDNSTTRRMDYDVSAAIVDGPQWSNVTETLDPGEFWIGTVSGQILEGSCRSRLEIDMSVSGDPEDHFPLAVFFRDDTLNC